MANDLLISKTRVKIFLKKQGLRVSLDFYPAFNEEVTACLVKVAKRAKGNKRLTVYSQDI